MIKISNEEFKLLSEYIHDKSGIHLKKEKKNLLVGRLANMLNEKGFSNFMDYYKHLKQDIGGTELSHLIDKVTTNHTYFMREVEHFDYLKKEVLPYLEQTVHNKDLRIWCAASSTGEEAYTLAMILEEYFYPLKGKWDKKLLATDLSLNVLEQAKKGIYSKEKVSSLPKMWTLNYFDKTDKETYQIKNKIRDEIIFRRFNLLEPIFPFKRKFHVIFCRNVMIYFDNETKVKLINKFYNSMESGGYLFIGHSESIDREKSDYKYIKPSIYRKM